jgi:hypothetical protein
MIKKKNKVNQLIDNVEEKILSKCLKITFKGI